mgnify:CR=1 FL=1
MLRVHRANLKVESKRKYDELVIPHLLNSASRRIGQIQKEVNKIKKNEKKISILIEKFAKEEITFVRFDEKFNVIQTKYEHLLSRYGQN